MQLEELAEDVVERAAVGEHAEEAAGARAGAAAAAEGGEEGAADVLSKGAREEAVVEGGPVEEAAGGPEVAELGDGGVAAGGGHLGDGGAVKVAGGDVGAAPEEREGRLGVAALGAEEERGGLRGAGGERGVGRSQKGLVGR